MCRKTIRLDAPVHRMQDKGVDGEHEVPDGEHEHEHADEVGAASSSRVCIISTISSGSDTDTDTDAAADVASPRYGMRHYVAVLAMCACSLLGEAAGCR